ncbi:MAG TPA: T9SS type A sorting domain-containing protein [Ignavibacteriales bacterium]|nr:T9SS type A sorting domain-containing protein [Ignavibacteriales bacterium]
MKKTFSIVGLLVLLFSFSTYGQLNYRFSAAPGTFTPLTGASAFASWTTATANDDEFSVATDIGFTFNYAGTDYTQFQVSTNGFLRFGTGLVSSTSADALDGTLRKIVAPLWDNLAVTATASDITYLLEGSAPNRTLTVEWKNVKWNKSASAANSEFQVKLYEGTNKIEFVYGAMTKAATPATSASIGLADNTSITKAGSATGKFLSINVGGTAGARVYHQTMSVPFSAITNSPDPNTVFTFEPVTPAPIAAGTYTVGGTNPDYKTLSDAAMALNINGIAGAVVLKVREGSYDDVFHLIDVSGTSASNTITLMNESGTVVVSPMNGSSGSTAGASSADAIIRLDGTQYTTIQGLTLNDNGLASVQFKFDLGVCVGNSQLNGNMIQGGRFNYFKDLNIDMKCTTGTNHTGAIGFRFYTSGSAETDTSLATSYNKIENCTVTGFWRAGVKTYGISGVNPDRGNVVTGCTFGNFSIKSGTGSDVRVFELDCEKSILIEKNKIQNIETTIMTTNNIYGIWFNPASSGTNFSTGTIIIRNNEIDSLSNNGTGVTTGVARGICFNAVGANTDMQIYGNKIHNLYSSGTTGNADAIFENISAGTTVTSEIYNNMIYDLKAPKSTNTSTAVRGIALLNGAGAGTFSVYNNTIYLDNLVTPAVTGTNVAHRSACVYIGTFSTGILDLQNNILVNKMGTSFTGTGVSSAACFAATTTGLLAAIKSTSDNNLYFADTTIANNCTAFGGTTVLRTMSDYRALANMGSRESNSFSADPAASFLSAVKPYDFHISPSSWLVKSQGTPNAIVSSDIDGDARSTDFATGPVSIGADEYIPTGKPSVTVTGSIADGETMAFTGFDGRTVGEITWHKGKGTLPDSAAFAYVPGGQLTTPAPASIFKNYSLSTFGGAKGWNADLKLYYNPSSELNGIPEADLKMHQKSGDLWSQLPTTIDASKHFALVNIIGGADFTLGKDAPVPTTSIASAREDLNGDLVPDKKGQTLTIAGVVVTDNLTASDTGSVYYLNDRTAGIVLSAAKKFTKELAIGDSLRVTGLISQFNGQTEIVPADTIVGEAGSMNLLKEKASLPNPVVVSIKDLNSEEYEGNLVVVRGLSKMSSSNPWPVAKDTLMTVGAGSDSLSMFVDMDTKLPGSAEPEWPLDITGVVAQNSVNLNDGYMLIPRNTSDVSVPVLTLATAREDLNNDFIPDRKGQTLKAKGIVVSPDFTASAGGNNYYITDGTAGVLLYSGKKLSTALNIGDSIAVKGRIDQYKGATEFVPLTTEVGENGSVTVLKTNARVPSPIEISVKDVNSEKYEGSLVKVKGLSKKPSGTWAASGKNASIWVEAGNDSTILFIDADTDIDGTDEVKWPANITGVISQYTSSATANDGYELLPRSVKDFDVVNGVEEGAKVPASYALSQNYPNPFNPSTTITFDLKSNANVTLKIYSVLGQEVLTLVNGGLMPAGHKTMTFNASNLPSGMYIYRLEARGIDGSNFTGVKKMMLLK